MQRLVVVDCETTGFSHAHGDRIITFAAIELLNGAPARALHLVFNPERRSHPRALAVHGLTDGALRAQPLFSSAAAEILAFLNGACIVAHNASFDLGFLNSEFRLCGRGGFVPATSICTMARFRSAHSGPAKLDDVAAHFGIDTSQRKSFHGALVDADVASQVLQAMVLGVQPVGISLFPPTNSVGEIHKDKVTKSFPRQKSPQRITPPPSPSLPLSSSDLVDGIEGRVFAFTGTMRALRTDIIGIIDDLGGIGKEKGLTRDTDVLVIGSKENSKSSKTEKAYKMRLETGRPLIITEDDLFKLIDGIYASAP